MTGYVWGGKETQYFYQLTPEAILEAVARLGLNPSGRCLTLNSMENRVYELEVYSDDQEDPQYVIAKFYRPGRWSQQQILQEHQFLQDLVEDEVPAIAPLSFDGKTLFTDESTGLFYCLFPRKGGRAPDELNHQQYQLLGRMLARLHNTGSKRSAPDRVELTPESFGVANLQFLLNENCIPETYKSSYQQAVELLIKTIKPLFENIKYQRIHGDCHWGNIIYRPDEGPYFIDLDDMLNGPVVQDIWLCVPGNDAESRLSREVFLEGYQSMREFDRRELKLIEPLRALRYIHFTAWIAKRWEDPAFQKAFPHFQDPNYWQIAVTDINNQIRAIQADSQTQFGNY